MTIDSFQRMTRMQRKWTQLKWTQREWTQLKRMQREWMQFLKIENNDTFSYYK